MKLYEGIIATVPNAHRMAALQKSIEKSPNLHIFFLFND